MVTEADRTCCGGLRNQQADTGPAVRCSAGGRRSLLLSVVLGFSRARIPSSVMMMVVMVVMV